MATHWSVDGKRRTSPPSCHTPSSPRWPGSLPWFMWMSWTPLPGSKWKILSGLPALRPPALAERVDDRIGLARGPVDIVRQPVAQVVVVPRQARRQEAHVQPVEQIAADEVEAAAVRLLGQGGEALGQRRQLLRQRMPEIFDHEEQQLRRAELGHDVDGQPVVRPGRGHVHLVVRAVHVVFAPGRQDPTAQYAVMLQAHDHLPCRRSGVAGRGSTRLDPTIR